MLNGIDIASYQGMIDVSKIPSDFVIIKATEGTGYVNPYCDSRYQLAKKVGKLLGVYHFARVGNAIEQADYFVKNIKGYIGEAVLILDFENTGDEQVIAQGPGWAKLWLDRVYALTGVRPMIYLSQSVTKEYNWSGISKNYGLWVARYESMRGVQGYNKPNPPSVGSWSLIAMYQYTSTGRLAGYTGDLDCNVFYGDEKAWRAYVKSGKSNPPEETRLYHNVKYGETLSELAYRYGTSVSKLQKLNSIRDVNMIYVGQRLRVK